MEPLSPIVEPVTVTRVWPCPVVRRPYSPLPLSTLSVTVAGVPSVRVTPAPPLSETVLRVRTKLTLLPATPSVSLPEMSLSTIVIGAPGMLLEPATAAFAPGGPPSTPVIVTVSRCTAPSPYTPGPNTSAPELGPPLMARSMRVSELSSWVLSITPVSRQVWVMVAPLPWIVRADASVCDSGPPHSVSGYAPAASTMVSSTPLPLAACTASRSDVTPSTAFTTSAKVVTVKVAARAGTWPATSGPTRPTRKRPVRVVKRTVRGLDILAPRFPGTPALRTARRKSRGARHPR